MRYFYTILLVLLLIALPASAAEVSKPGPKERCPVCGMFVAPYPDWLASLLFEDGSRLYFDGVKDLLRYYLALPNANDSRTREQISAIFVTDYYSTQTVPAQQALFVSGSDVFGPMGAELIPVVGKSAAKSFMRDHNGKQLLRFDQLTSQQLPKQ